MLELDKYNFNSCINGDMPAIVDFWAPWCTPCIAISPVFEKISSQYKGKLKFAKLNVDENQEIAANYGIRGIPCLILFNKGKEIDRILGAMAEEQLKSKISEMLTKIK